MGKLKVYHLKALLMTYLIWAVLIALVAVRAAQVGTGNLAGPVYGLRFWLLVHVTPFMALSDPLGGMMLWCVIIPVVTIIPTITGLFIRGSDGTILVAFGISVWFFWGFMLAGLAVT